MLKEGLYEKELAKELELFCLKNGAERLSFSPIICFGVNSAIPHHKSDDTKLKNGVIVLIDMGVVFNNYTSDFTRTFCFGAETKAFKDMYSLVKEASFIAKEQLRDNQDIILIDKNIREFFRKNNSDQYFIHGLGHGIGLEVHETPRIKWNEESKPFILKEGMFITIEPGLYRENFGGVRYEDTVLISKNGYENLYPQELP